MVRSRKLQGLGALLTASLSLLAGCSQGSRLPRSLTILPGAINGAVIARSGSTIAFYGDPAGRLRNVEKVFLTHHRRDVAWAALELSQQGARVVAPAAELPYLEGATGFWDEFRAARFHDYAQQSTKILTVPLAVQEPARGGSPIHWRGLTIEVLDTPGYTRGAVSYIVELEGKRIAFDHMVDLACPGPCRRRASKRRIAMYSSGLFSWP